MCAVSCISCCSAVAIQILRGRLGSCIIRYSARENVPELHNSIIPRTMSIRVYLYTQ